LRAGESLGWTPATDIYEDEEGLSLKFELAGVEPKDVDIRFENGVLTIKGERKLENEEKKENYHRVELSYGAFNRSFSLPPTVDLDKIEAKSKSGMLVVYLPKKDPVAPAVSQTATACRFAGSPGIDPTPAPHASSSRDTVQSRLPDPGWLDIEAEPFFAVAKQGVELIAELYEIEKLCPTGPPGDELRRRLRDERSHDVVRRIHEWALATRALPESLGKAIAFRSDGEASLWAEAVASRP